MASREHLQQLLAKIHIFAGLEHPTLEKLADTCLLRRLHASELLAREGEEGHEFFLILDGEVEIFEASARGERRLALLGPEEFCGEMCIIECRTRVASIRSTKPTLVAALTAGDMHHLFKENPAQFAILVLNIARDLSRRLREMDSRFAELPGQ